MTNDALQTTMVFETTGYIPTSTNPPPTNDAAFMTMETINIILLAVTLWVMLSMLVYGTKTGRWRSSPGTSSLNSGATYVSCFIATLLTIPKLAMTEVLHRVRFLPDYTQQCKTAIDVAAAVYFTSLYASYLFLWILQRRIYTHPCVRERVSKHVDRFSKVFIAPLTAAFVASLVSYNLQAKYTFINRQGCVQLTDKQKITVAAAVMASAAIIVQVIMVGLFVYPALRARFPALNEANQTEENGEIAAINPATSRWHRFFATFCGSHISPVEMAVKRTVLSATIIVVTDTLATGIDALVVAPSLPVVFHTAEYDISSLINVFCMLGTFGFGSKILTLFCPTCPKTTSSEKETTDIVHDISKV